jgi:hypothetical protein
MGKYRGVAMRLRDVKAAHDLPGVDLCIKSAGDFDEIPILMKSAVDLVALDGHGCKTATTATSAKDRAAQGICAAKMEPESWPRQLCSGSTGAGKVRSSAPWKAPSGEARQLSSEELMELSSRMPSESTCPYCGY